MAAAGRAPRPAVAAPAPQRQRGGFLVGLVIGLLVGLGVALVVALYITKAPVPFVNKVPQRTAEQDAAEAERNRHWDPNAPLAGKNPARPQPVASEPAAAPVAEAPGAASAPRTAASAARPARDPAAILSGQEPAAAPARPIAPPATAGPPAAATAPAGPASGAAVQFYVQVGAFSTPQDAEAQRAKVAMTGLSAKVMAREQSGRTVYRVRLGPYDNRTMAEDVQDKLGSAGMEANLVRVER
jgi:cell division protein FtsN